MVAVTNSDAAGVDMATNGTELKLHNNLANSTSPYVWQLSRVFIL
jgi:hypothetical protein